VKTLSQFDERLKYCGEKRAHKAHSWSTPSVLKTLMGSPDHYNLYKCPGAWRGAKRELFTSREARGLGRGEDVRVR
jgi:hypothetical protein